MPTSIIVPSRYPDIFNECRRRIDFFAAPQEKILVRDGLDITDPRGWTTIQAPMPFVYSRNINLGINQTSGDVLLTNDDVRFVNKETVERLDYVMGCNPEIGILSPRIDGGIGNVDQARVRTSVLYTQMRLAFVCVLIRRAVIDQIGLLDERFNAYGWDDVDYCRRAVNAGWKMAVTVDATVRHGHGKQTYSSSYLREPRIYSARCMIAQNQYQQKWGDTKFSNFGGASENSSGNIHLPPVQIHAARIQH
jgi:hypothetical protein